MAPAVEGGDCFVEVGAGFGGDSGGRREDDAGGLARLQLEHPAAEGMPFQFAAQPHERGRPAGDDPARSALVAHANPVHGVRAGRGRGVANQARGTP